VVLVILIYGVFFVAQFYNIIFYGYPPFISSSYKNIRKIIEIVKLRGDETVYELGSGRSRFLRMLEKKYPSLKLVGVENLFSIHFPNYLRLKLQGSKIKLLNKNIFDIDLRQADIIYCYLNNTTMIPLGLKLIAECQPGTQIISQAFSVPQLSPQKVIEADGKKIYFYTI
jgi:hypothetical protein